MFKGPVASSQSFWISLFFFLQVTLSSLLLPSSSFSIFISFSLSIFILFTHYLPYLLQNAYPRLLVSPSPRSLLMTERTGSVRTAFVRTIRCGRNIRTPPTLSRPFYRYRYIFICKCMYVLISLLRLFKEYLCVGLSRIRQIVSYCMLGMKKETNIPLCLCVLQFATKRPSTKELSSSNSSLSSTSETANESTSPNTPEAAPRARRRVRLNYKIHCNLSYNM